MIGLDSGFFVQLVRGESQATEVWQTLKSSPEPSSLVSCISIYELYKLIARKVVDKAKTEGIISVLPDVCTIIWLNQWILQKSAQLSQKTGLAMGDAIIVQSLIEGGARTVYTTDSDLAKLKIGLRVIKV
jgi:predicted nucleic acid-binding protein